MGKKKTRFYAFFMMLILLFTSMNLNAFGAGAIDGKEGLSNGTARIALYQNGDLGAAYDENDNLEQIYELEEGTAEYAIYQGLINMQEKISLDDYNLTTTEGINLYRQVINAHSELFYVSNYIQYSYYSNGTLAYFTPAYIASATEIEGMVSKFESAVDTALAGIDATMTDLEKALYLHDYLVKKASYDQENYEAGTVPNISHSAYGCLVLDICVCDGYALAYSYLLKEVGIECHLITGPGHAWNAVKLNGNYYFVDATWDDPVSSYGDMFDYVGHNYFLLTGNELKADGSTSHSSWDQNITPTDTTYSNAPFRNVTGTYGYYNDNWYYWYYLNGSTSTPIIAKTSDPMTVGTQFASLPSKWYVYGSTSSYYPGYYGGTDVSASNGKLYYSSTSQIFSLDLDAANPAAEVVTTIDTTTANGYLYGLKIFGDTMYIGVAQTANEKETIYTLDITEEKNLATAIEISVAGNQTEYDFLYTEENYQLIANPIDGQLPATVSWSSSDTSVATIDQNGLVTAVGKGETTITATSDTLVATYKITVYPAVTGLTATTSNVSINKGETVSLTILPKNDTVLRDDDIEWWVPTDESIIKYFYVENEPMNTLTMEGISGGEGEVAVKFGGYTYSFYITVHVEMTDFTFEKIEIELGIGSTYTATPAFTPEDVYPIPTASWKSSNESVATVDENGKITGVSDGDATITCTINEKEVTITVHVTSVTIGDVNSDGDVNANDALAVLKKVASMTVPVFHETAADCDGNSKIDANDALWILKKVAHII